MVRINTEVAPYYETTAGEISKQYYKLLAVPGRVAQAREITVLQGLLQQAIKSVGDAIMSNGDIIEGCQIIVAEDHKSVMITEGRIYMEGIVHNVSKTTLSITGVGTETIGVKLNEYIITDADDPSLKDPAQGYDNYGQTGCDRLKKELNFVLNDTDSSPLATLIDGAVTVESVAPNYDTLTQTLARRTYDESGSYLVKGLNTRVEPKIPEDSNNYNAVIESGKAYVLGYELKLPTARRISVPRSKTVKEILYEDVKYNSSVDTEVLDQNPYVESITKVRGLILQSNESQSITSNTDSKQLTMPDAYRITKIVQDSNVLYDVTSENNVCKLGIDFELQRDGSYKLLKWLGTNKHPTLNVTYYVNYEHYTLFENGVDYELINNNALHWLSGGKKPLNGSNYDITYNQYLARKDLVYIDQYGSIKIELGAPDEDGYEVPPVAPVNTLPLAQILNPPNGYPNATQQALRISVINVGLTRFTMNDIQNLLNRVKKTEYNQAILSLNDDARSRTTVNSKKGILTDPLVDFSRIDYGFNVINGEPVDPEKPVFEMALDLDVGIAYNPLNVSSYILEANFLSGNNTVKKYDRLITLPISGERNILSQKNATKSFQVNPYSVFPQLPTVSITPAVDSWIDYTTVEVPVSLNNSTIVSTNVNILYNNVRRSWGGFFNHSTSETSSTTTDVSVGSTTSTNVVESVISEEAITYMRSIPITVEGSNYPSNLDNIKCSIDGTVVNLTPLGSTIAGTEEGTVKSNDFGYLKAQFTVPEGIRTGTREIKLWSDIIVDLHKSEGYTLYQSTGISKTIQRTITTVTTVLLQRNVTNTVTTTDWIDPVAQTFVLDKLSVVKGIDIYFESKPSGISNDVVTLEIRDVINGSIGTTIYGQTSLSPSQVSVSADSKTPTRFNFNDPVVLDKDTAYAFVIRSVSDSYRVWVSEIGGIDVKTGEVVLKNSYMTGVMLSSSNNSVWTAHQTMDIKFDIYEDIYNESGTLTFNTITPSDITRLDLSAESVVLNGTSLKWYYSINGGSSYQSISPGSIKEIGDVATGVVFKAEFSRTSTENITPLLAYDTLLLVGSSYKTEGSYVGVNVTGMDPYTHVTVIMDTLIPTGTSIDVYCSSDNGNTRTKLTLDPTKSKKKANGRWYENVYTATISSSTQCRIFIETTSYSSTTTPRFSAIKILMD